MTMTVHIYSAMRSRARLVLLKRAINL